MSSLVLGLGMAAFGQSPAVPSSTSSPAEPAAAAVQDQTPPAPKGQVLFQSHGDSPEPLPAVAEAAPEVAEKPSGPALTDAERSAILFTGYDLDARIDPATAHLAMRARVTVKNMGAVALERVALQVSSTLKWESVTLLSAAGSRRLEMSQHLLDTDADHTAKANEAVIALPEPLAPGQTVQLDTFYDGTIVASAGRLERLGATQAQAAATDWDAIGGDATALRGFGDVLWYPVASPQLFLGDGAQLFHAIGALKLREEQAKIRLRLSVAYKGDAPTAAYFCGRRQALKAISDDENEPIATGSGVATAEFEAEALGFRVPSLFLVGLPETLIAPLPAFYGAADSAAERVEKKDAAAGISSSNVAVTGAGEPMVAVETTDEGSVKSLETSAEDVAPLLQEWLGARPLSALTVLDHSGQPFEDGPLLVGPVAALGTASAQQGLVHSMTHAWVQTGQPWMDEGLAQFMSLLWIEREKGREVANAELDDLMRPVAIAEPEIDAGGAKNDVGQPLIAATSELYYRRKAAAVWWMLRGIVGDEALQEALQAWRMQAPGVGTAEQQALGFERLLEHSGKKNAANPIDLKWFFNDWVLHDRGLPDLSIVDVTPRQLPAGQGHNVGYLVSVTVKNDGAAGVQVPVTIRSATFSTTSQLRVGGFGSATARVIVESPPDEVLVNDGGTPEVRTSFHKVTVNAVKPE